MKKTLIICAILATVLAACGSGSGNSADPSIGAHNGGCRDDNSCDEGLFCVNGTCASESDLDIVFELMLSQGFGNYEKSEELGGPEKPLENE